MAGAKMANPSLQRGRDETVSISNGIPGAGL